MVLFVDLLSLRVVMSLLLLLMDESIVNSVTGLKFVSYNCRGFNDAKSLYLSKLLKHCDVLFLQEHWLSESQLDGLGDISCTHLASGISGFGCSDVFPQSQIKRLQNV